MLGRGGMGEVYRATDLTLGQAVALKFLPEAAAGDGRGLARFYNEVRMARQVTHPNVCRVYDVGQVDGLHYISMEFVDGEDLSSLLRRIGRLPPDKAIEIARKLCAGLAAAHEKGVLHRDLKPANIMIDGRGNVVIMDFGLAGLSEQLQADVRSGTPAYMSPEQLAGTEVTAKSDIYALGLVLYELFTGKRAFEACSVLELMQMQERAEPVSATTLVRDLDPLVERAILRCLEHDPRRRPASAMAVAAALPGGDQLAAALAAGETPSPELVAAAGETEGLRPPVALAWLAAALVGIAALCVMGAKWSILGKMPLDAPPDALARDARNLLKSFGYTARPGDSAWGLTYATSYFEYLKRHPAEYQARWSNPVAGTPPLIQFWYRESPRSMTAERGFSTAVTEGDPPLEISGMKLLQTDADGKLFALAVVPPQVEAPAATGNVPAVDWTGLFRAAGLDQTRFQPAEPQWTPLANWDARAAWTGLDPATGAKLRVEAAAWRGKPVFFRLIGPWTTPERIQPPDSSQQLGLVALIYILLVAACVIAWHNFRSGRGDRRGGAKLALFYFLCFAVSALLTAHHAPTMAELELFWKSVALAAINAGAVWMIYLALEPWVRRHWPGALVSWSRLTTKGIRDPLVGRHILYGVAVGCVMGILKFVQLRLHGAASEPITPSLDALLGLRHVTGAALQAMDNSLFDPIFVLFLLFLVRVILRNEWAAAAAAVAILTAVTVGSGTVPAIDIPATVIFQAIDVLVLLRLGVLPIVAADLAQSFLQNTPATLDFSSWYAGVGLTAPVLIALIAWFGFRTALAGRPLLSGEAL